MGESRSLLKGYTNLSAICAKRAINRHIEIKKRGINPSFFADVLKKEEIFRFKVIVIFLILQIPSA